MGRNKKDATQDVLNLYNQMQEDFAVVYNGSVGGTYEVFAKYSEQDVRSTSRAAHA